MGKKNQINDEYTVIDDVDRFYCYSIYKPTKTLYIGSVDYNSEDAETGTDFAMAESVVKGLHVLDQETDTRKPITVIMNNPGGDEDAGYAIYDSIVNCKSEVYIEVRGNACSMGAIILQAGDWRRATRNAKIMVHYGQSWYEGHSLDFLKYAKQVEKGCRQMEDLFLERLKEKDPKWTRSKFRREFSFDKWLLPDEAMEMGLIDEVIY